MCSRPTRSPHTTERRRGPSDEVTLRPSSRLPRSRGPLAGLAVLSLILLATGSAADASPQAAPTTHGTAGFAWGYNNRGCLGLGSSAQALTPVPVNLPAGTTGMSAGVDFTVARTRDGRVYAWGDNRDGQLGQGTRANHLAAVRVRIPGSPLVIRVDAAGEHTVALARNGRIYAWGNNARGQLGDGTTTDRSTPVRVHLPRSAGRVVDIAAGTDHTLAVTASGRVLAWGRSTEGQLNGASGADRTLPTFVPLPPGSHVTKVAAGLGHSLALTSRGTVLTWGEPQGTQVGGTPGRRDVRSVARLDHLHVIAIDAGTDSSLALTRRGRVFSWGDGSDGQLGDGTTADRLTPVKVGGLPPVTAISAAGGHVVAVARNGQLWVWGANQFGQLGDGTTTNSTRPQRLTALSGAQVTVLATGELHTLVAVNRGPSQHPATGLRDGQAVSSSARSGSGWGWQPWTGLVLAALGLTLASAVAIRLRSRRQPALP